MGLLAASALVGPSVSAAPTTATASAPAGPSAQEFGAVIQSRCARCHNKQASSLDALVKANWLKPGNPEGSPVYTMLNKARPAHNVSDKEKAIVHDFIQAMKPASQPAR